MKRVTLALSWLTNGLTDSWTLPPQLRDVACGLAHIHSLKPAIAHGNIKPENVIVKNDLQAALCDFGVSRIFEGIAGVSDSTITGDVTGRTAGYQAKELLQENAPSASAPGDVYALGGLILAVRSSLRFGMRFADASFAQCISDFEWEKSVLEEKERCRENCRGVHGPNALPKGSLSLVYG